MKGPMLMSINWEKSVFFDVENDFTYLEDVWVHSEFSISLLRNTIAAEGNSAICDYLTYGFSAHSNQDMC